MHDGCRNEDEWEDKRRNSRNKGVDQNHWRKTRAKESRRKALARQEAFNKSTDSDLSSFPGRQQPSGCSGALSPYSTGDPAAISPYMLPDAQDEFTVHHSVERSRGRALALGRSESVWMHRSGSLRWPTRQQTAFRLGAGLLFAYRWLRLSPRRRLSSIAVLRSHGGLKLLAHSSCRRLQCLAPPPNRRSHGFLSFPQHLLYFL